MCDGEVDGLFFLCKLLLEFSPLPLSLVLPFLVFFLERAVLVTALLNELDFLEDEILDNRPLCSVHGVTVLGKHNTFNNKRQ